MFWCAGISVGTESAAVRVVADVSRVAVESGGSAMAGLEVVKTADQIDSVGVDAIRIAGECVSVTPQRLPLPQRPVQPAAVPCRTGRPGTGVHRRA